jgi:YgiT-type zinc finger domain-containing protein
MEVKTIVEVDIETSDEAPARCENCGSSAIHAERVRTAFWAEDRLVVIEDVPALVCKACHERYFDDATVTVLDLMRGDGFPPERARREITVPVFSFDDRLVPRES